MAGLLIVSHDTVGEVMAGPGIRYYHLASILAQHLPTTLAVPDEARPAGPVDFAIVTYRRREWRSLAPHAQTADICLFPSDVADELPQLGQSNACLIVDGYDPLLVEWLALSQGAEAGQRRHDWARRMVELARQALIGDFYICASERQRDWWLGLLEAGGRLNPLTFDADPSLRSLVDVVPYGLPVTPLPAPKPVVKGVWEGIAPGDRLLLWGGGLWPWLDPLTAIRAVAKVRASQPDVKLIFPGTRHPNPAMAGMPNQTAHAKALAAELDLMDTAVFFGDWMPYVDWPHMLQECTLALSLHHDTVETRLAFRSRVLEYIWAGLPIVATGGDATSDLIARYDLGIVVAEQDVDGAAGALAQLLAEPRSARSADFAHARAECTWERAAAPLVAYCRAPARAADRVGNGRQAYYDPYAQLRAERDYWRALAQGYANGRIMRALTWLEQKRQRWLAPG